MGDFMTNLWESVLTSGTTPTLLVATNVTFAVLQVLLGALLVATYSIHFLVLSVLCGGLWVSINWFANELIQAQGKEEEAERLRKRAKAGSGSKSTARLEDSADDEGEDTEVEDSGLRESRDSLMGSQALPSTSQNRPNEVQQAAGAAATGVESSSSNVRSRQSKVDESDRSGDISTDSEWEKVDDEQ